MNIKSVLRTYSLLRQLSDDETALLETLRAMNESEREALVETLSPQPVRKSSTKKSASKKSSRASSLEQQIKGRATGRQEAASRCGVLTGDGVAGVDVPCNALRDDPIHDPDGGYLSHHPFSPAAPTASDQSSANGGAGSGTASSETRMEDASNAVHEVSAAENG